MWDVACVGVYTADVIAETVDRLPDSGKLNHVDSIRLFSGGCAMNVCIDLSKLGAAAAAVGLVGRDAFGRFLIYELEKNKVDVCGMRVTDDARTSASVVLVNSDGERSFLHDMGASSVFASNDVDDRILENSKIVFVGGSLLMPTFDGEGCAEVLRRAREFGKTTVLDVAWDDNGRWMDALAPCLPYVDYFIPSVEEAEMLSGKTDQDEQANVFFSFGVKVVVIKLGDRGCYLRKSGDDKGMYFPSFDRIRASDTTGAGDAFCAGFLYGLLSGMTEEECCVLANAVGAHCVMATGATTSIPTYKNVRDFIETYKEN